jgi:hypothetical protein
VRLFVKSNYDPTRRCGKPQRLPPPLHLHVCDNVPIVNQPNNKQLSCVHIGNTTPCHSPE